MPEYTPTYLTSIAEIHHISAIPVSKIHSNLIPGENIRPVYLSQFPNSKIQQIECKVDTRVGCNILPLYQAQTLFVTE